jgi:hypothetical protein
MTIGATVVSLRNRVVERVARALPGPIGAKLDGLRPSLREGFGGPFNGQQRRIEAVRDLFARVTFTAVVETGTYRATTTLFLRSLTTAPIVTIEASSRYFHYARRRLRHADDISLIAGDSAEVLRWLAHDPARLAGPTFFYLDAHWMTVLPLRGELAAIVDAWPDHAILIDDFRVAGDDGYAFDDYGSGDALDLSILTSLRERPLVLYWPASPSVAETGARRGWCIVASAGAVDDSIRASTMVRRAGTLAEVLG